MKRVALLAVAAWPGAAWGHAGEHHAASAVPGWTPDASVVAPLLLAAALYATGFSRLWRRSGGGREVHRRNAVRFAAGWLILAGALLSPLHAAGERSFTLHMIEHELIMVPAALLLAISSPLAVMLWALPASMRRWLGGASRIGWLIVPWRLLTGPVTATIMQAIALIAWHAPMLFDRALRHDGWHIAQHISFLASALCFWWAMTQARGRGQMLSALCLFATSLIGGGLGALMAFAASPWYAGYAAMPTMDFGLSPAEDQQLAGLIMWIPGGMAHAGAALWLLAKALRQREASHAALVG